MNALDLRAYTLDSVVPVNRLMTLLTQAVNDPEITQAEADDLAAQMQAAIDQLQPVSEESTSAEGGAQTSDDASAADTSAAAQSGMFRRSAWRSCRHAHADEAPEGTEALILCLIMIDANG